MNLSPLTQSFVLHFGEMGSRWGINRTVGQIYALIFVANRPLNADEITEKLGISRSNVSMSLKELMAWRLVRLEHSRLPKSVRADAGWSNPSSRPCSRISGHKRGSHTARSLERPIYPPQSGSL